MIQYRGAVLRKPTCDLAGKSITLGNQDILGVVMKQKVVIRAIIKDSRGRILLLRRRGGRESIDGKFELPGGKMVAGEQPEDTLRRTLRYHTGLSPKSYQLFEVLSFVDPDDNKTQYLFIVYLVTLEPNHNKLVLDSGYDRYIYKTKQNLQLFDVTNSTIMLLGLDDKNDSARRGNKGSFIIYTDGGSRGSSGVSAAACVILDWSGDIVAEDKRFLGNKDSLYAEYAGVLLGFLKAKALGLRRVELRSDSLTVVNQVNGDNSVVRSDVALLHESIKRVKAEFETARLVHIRRKFNYLADGLVNRSLDEVEKKQKKR